MVNPNTHSILITRLILVLGRDRRALISNMIGRVDRNVSESPLGLQSTVVVVLVVFASTGYFFWETFVSTVRNSQDTDGAIGKIARCCGQQMPRLCGIRKRRYSSPASLVAVANAPRSNTRRLSLNAGLGRRALLRKVKSKKARQLVSSAEQHRISLDERITSNQVDARRRLVKRLKRRKQTRPASPATGIGGANVGNNLNPRRPQKWETHIDDSTGVAYYFNVETGETTWDLPRGCRLSE